MDQAVSLRDITADTVLAICDLELREDQQQFVAPNAVSIAQAHFRPEAHFQAIYAGETPVGFLMWRAEENGCFLWRFMIDRRHQMNGYGRAALALLFARLRAEGCGRITTTYLMGESGPRDFYIALGFKDTGETRPNGERYAARSL